ncbi:hypothetical protein A2950_00300 [Candidatus Kaiserbacteria bacterium RIFCSPLOWO2_01_FULL_55_19]|uniref:Uncharacterized protein n=1 Tax=Candidatus Kaiserbacteria bacterium RIFCSPLOWO2_01_FULL_55_19 TaxID=1798516 RepID=A0A1F6ERY5_9BACT|nr:MAG: hypothetical protein A2950_00300 [Candidatus Kaiserbacteria bacterium RIFCSPLOWO2_01_FULL_55_19]
MNFAKFFPVALIVGILAAISVLGWQYFSDASRYPWLQIWPVFITWGLYFVAGAKIGRLHKEILGITGGILFGYLTLLIAFAPSVQSALGGTWSLPVTVFVIATIIVLLELTDWFEFAPVYFIAYAGYFAYVFGKFSGGAGNATEMFYFWVPMMVGLAFGVVTAVLRKRLLEAEGVYGSAQETVFDKETA